MLNIQETQRFGKVVITQPSKVSKEFLISIGLTRKELKSSMKEDLDNDYIKTKKTKFGEFKTKNIWSRLERGQVKFSCIESNEITYIITERFLTKKELNVLNWWLNGCENEIKLKKRDWKEWLDVNEGIAFRGNQRMSYTLYAKK